MNFIELIQRVQKIINDDSQLSSIKGEDIGAMLNQAMIEISGGLHSNLGSWITPPLPELFTIDTIITDVDYPYVDMPDNFQRNLQFVANSNGIEVSLADSFISFVEVYPLLNKVGRISDCLEFGKKFYYQKIPTTPEVITLHYYRKPIDMEDPEDVPDGLPEQFHDSLLVTYVCWKILDLIKDLPLDSLEKLIAPFKERFYTNLSLLELSIPYENRNLRLM